MGLDFSCLQRNKHDDEIPCVSRKQSTRLENSMPPPPPRRIRSIPPPPPRMRTISNEAVAISKTNRDDDFYDIDDDKSEIHTNDILINSIINDHQNNIKIIDSINIPPIPDTPKSFTKSFNITNTNPQNNDNNLINSCNDFGNHHINAGNNNYQYDKGGVTPIYSDLGRPQLVVNVSNISNISNTKQFTSNTLCVPTINKSNRNGDNNNKNNKNNKNNSNNNSNRTRSISATMSVTASNISALSSVASMISTLSPASLSAQSTSNSKSNNSNSYTSNTRSTSNSIETDNSSSSCASNTNTDRETNSNTNTHTHTPQSNQHSPISPDIDDNGFPDTDHRVFIHPKINVAQQHLSLQQSFAQSNSSQISQLSVAIPLPPPTRFGASFDSSLQQSPSGCTIIVTPASPANKTGRKTHSGRTDKKCVNREDSRSSIWEQPDDDELNESESNKDDDDEEEEEEEEELKGDEDSYLTDEEDEVESARKKTVHNVVYETLSPKPTKICYYDGEEGNDEKNETLEMEYCDTIMNDKKHRKSSILSTISALSRLTKSKCSKHENGLLMDRLSLSNKLSTTDRVTSSQQEQEEEEEQQTVRIICDDFDEIENKSTNNNNNDGKQIRNFLISPKCGSHEEFDNLTVKSLSQCKSPYGGSFISRSMKSISSISPQTQQEALSCAYSAQSIVGDDSPFYSGKLDIEDITKYLQEDEFFNHYWINKNNIQYVD